MIKDCIKQNIKSKMIRRIYHSIRGDISLVKYYFRHKTMQIHAIKYHKFPIEKKIVFLNFDGRGYGCNPKYIAQEILNRKIDYDLVWLVSNNDANMPEKIRQVDINSEECYMELATAKVIINNVKGDIKLKKREGQYYIQTWHAGFSPKLLEKDAEKNLPKDYLLESKYNSEDSDVFLSNSIAQTEEYRKAFWCNCEILECGLPRNDIFFNYTKQDVERVKRKIGLNIKKKIIMFAPTFRTSNDSVERYGLDIVKIKKAIRCRFGEDYEFLLRMHPNIVENSIISDDAIDVSKYPDMQELLFISDIIITDYSSSIYDAMEMNKIVFIYANDIEEYQKIRGFKEDFFNLSIGISKNNDDLSNAIKMFDESLYQKQILEIKEKYCTFDNGSASKFVVDKIEEWMSE